MNAALANLCVAMIVTAVLVYLPGDIAGLVATAAASAWIAGYTFRGGRPDGL
jgi:hypothetical protein